MPESMSEIFQHFDVPHRYGLVKIDEYERQNISGKVYLLLQHASQIETTGFSNMLEDIERISPGFIISFLKTEIVTVAMFPKKSILNNTSRHDLSCGLAWCAYVHMVNSTLDDDSSRSVKNVVLCLFKYGMGLLEGFSEIRTEWLSYYCICLFHCGQVEEMISVILEFFGSKEYLEKRMNTVLFTLARIILHSEARKILDSNEEDDTEFLLASPPCILVIYYMLIKGN